MKKGHQQQKSTYGFWSDMLCSHIIPALRDEGFTVSGVLPPRLQQRGSSLGAARWGALSSSAVPNSSFLHIQENIFLPLSCTSPDIINHAYIGQEVHANKFQNRTLWY